MRDVIDVLVNERPYGRRNEIGERDVEIFSTKMASPRWSGRVARVFHWPTGTVYGRISLQFARIRAVPRFVLLYSSSVKRRLPDRVFLLRSGTRQKKNTAFASVFLSVPKYHNERRVLENP